MNIPEFKVVKFYVKANRLPYYSPLGTHQRGKQNEGWVYLLLHVLVLWQNKNGPETQIDLDSNAGLTLASLVLLDELESIAKFSLLILQK